MTNETLEEKANEPSVVEVNGYEVNPNYIGSPVLKEMVSNDDYGRSESPSHYKSKKGSWTKTQKPCRLFWT